MPASQRSAGGNVVEAAHDFHLSVRDALGDDGPGLFQAPDIVPDVLGDGLGEGIRRPRLLGQINRWADRVDQRGQMAGEGGVGLQNVDRRLHRPTIRVAEHEDQRRTEDLHAVFQARKTVGVDEVSSDSDDEQVTRTLIEHEIGSDPRIGAADDAGDRVLRGGARGPAGREVLVGGRVGHVARVAFEQPRQRRVWAERSVCGLGADVESRCGCERADGGRQQAPTRDEGHMLVRHGLAPDDNGSRTG